MTQPAKVQEPSMEEILASIRRIISDDDTANKAPAAVAPPKAVIPAAPPPLRAEAPRPAAVPPAPRPFPVPRERAAIQSDIDAVLGAPEKASYDETPIVAGNGALPSLDADILELTEDMAAEPPAYAPLPEPSAASFRTIDGQPDVFFAESPIEAEPEPEPEFKPEPIAATAAEDTLTSFGFDEPQNHSILSQATTAAVDSAFNQLAQSVFTQNGRTIEDLVRDMLRPMLKSWLDDNLPGLVERLVRAEIERVSRGRS